ncbi:MAG: RNA-directed DNA polymerase [Chrysiogenia bacterium]
MSYLQRDIGDDWFQDPIYYKDFNVLDNDEIYFEKNIRNNFGRYKAKEKEIFQLPKADFTLRYSLETNYYDRIMYLCLALPLMRLFDPLLNNRVYSHRFLGDKKYLFLNPVKQWQKFEGIVRSEAQGKTVLFTDIQNFFENIRISLLKSDLEKCLYDEKPETTVLINTRFIIDRLEECLENWSYDKTRGLPQNRDCSSFLANIYMRSIDEKMIAAGFEYFRYMDDIRIICADKFQARYALKELVCILRDKHLSLNGKKTKIVQPGSKEHKDLFVPNLKLKKIDSLLKTKKKANVAIGYLLLKELCLKLIKENEFGEREFRFCINRISKLARCKEYEVPKGYWDEISGVLINAITECPISTGQLYEFFISVGLSKEIINSIKVFLCDPRKCIYEWQNYWLWKLLILCNINDSKLIKRAKKVFKTDKLDPNKAGAILYLASFGKILDKRMILHSISKDDSVFLQRHKWLAIKGLNWKFDKIEQKKSEMHECLRGTYRVICERIHAIVTPPPPTKIDEILRSVHQYD